VNKTNDVALLDGSGHEVFRRQLSQRRRKEDDEEDALDYGMDGVNGRKVFSLWNSKMFLWQVHFSMSDGGYDAASVVDLRKGTFESIGAGTIEGVASDGLSFVGADSRWVGGYKGMGTAKLCKLSVWDAKTLKSTRIGPRLMLCFGACFP